MTLPDPNLAHPSLPPRLHPLCPADQARLVGVQVAALEAELTKLKQQPA